MRRYLKDIGFALFLALSANVYATDWTFNHNNVNLTANDTENTSGATVQSTLSRPSSGFLKKTVTSSSGTGAPSNGTTIFGLEVPGLYYIQEPTLASEGQMIYAVSSGSCPTSDYDGIFVFGQWDPNGANNVSSGSQVAFGNFSWSNSSHTATISNMYNLSSFSSIGTFSANVYFSSCSGGIFTASGSGDRGGTLYMSNEGGGFFKTNAAHGIMIVPQIPIPGANTLAGTYAAFRYDSSASATIKPMRLTIGPVGSNASGSALSDAGDNSSSDNSYSDTFTITGINTPLNGIVTGTLSHNGGAAVNLACAVRLTSRNVLFCAGQSPDLSSKPLNLVMVADAHYFLWTQGFDDAVTASAWETGTGKLYMGGAFSSYDGTSSKGVVRFNSDGSLDTVFALSGTGFSSTVNALEWDSANSKLYVGGNFTSYNGTTRGRIARLTSTGSLDTAFAPTGTGFAATVRSIAWDNANNKVYVGGDFTSFNGTTEKYVARLNSDGSLDTAFAPVGTGLANTVNAIALANGKLFAGGTFSTYNGTSASRLCRLETDGSLDSTFVQTGTGLSNTVYDLAWDSVHNHLYVGGQFSTYNGVSRRRIARFLTNGTLDTTFTGDLNNIVYGIDWDGSRLAAVGDFTQAGGVNRSYIARLNSDGSLDTTLTQVSPGVGQSLSTVSMDAGSEKVTVGGTFTGFNGHGTNRALRLNSDGTLDSTFGSMGAGVNAEVRYLRWDNTNQKLYAAGDFTSFNGKTLGYVARFVPSGNLDLGFSVTGTGFGALTRVIVPDTSTGKLYVGGDFTTYNGTTRNRLARLNSDGSLDTTFVPTGTAFSTTVKSVAIDQTAQQIYVSGQFTSFNGTSVGYLARLSSTGALDTTFNANIGTGANDEVRAIAWDSGNSKLYIVGDFTNFNSTGRKYVLRLNSDGTLDSAFAPASTGANAGIRNLDYDSTNNRVVIAGTLTAYDGTNRKYIARLKSDGTLDTAFSYTGSGLSSYVYSVAYDSTNNKYYIGGIFQSYNGTTRMNVARLNSDGTLDTAFAPSGTGLNGTVDSVVWDSTNSKLYVGGLFSTYNGITVDRLIRLSTTGALD